MFAKNRSTLFFDRRILDYIYWIKLDMLKRELNDYIANYCCFMLRIIFNSTYIYFLQTHISVKVYIVFSVKVKIYQLVYIADSSIKVEFILICRKYVSRR